MVKMNSVFFQALVLTIVVFLGGIFLGMLIEEGRMEKINDYYLKSEVSMMDILAFNNMIDSVEISCEELVKSNFELVDKVYLEAKVLEEYSDSNKLTENLENFNKKYSVLRTYLWIDAIKIRNECEKSFNTVVYLYNGSSKDLTIRAKQNVFSKILEEVKMETGKSVLLIPIDISSNLNSLNSLLSKYNPEQLELPIIIVNENKVFDKIDQKEEILSELIETIVKN